MTAGTPLSPETVAIQEEFVRSGSVERFQIVTLTDEEIVAADHTTKSVVPHYWYSNLSPADKKLALAVASRGLVARGWASASPSATAAEDLGLVPTERVTAVLALRKTARLIVLAEQTLGAETRARAYYLREGGTALEEAVNSGGLHRFSTLPETAALSDLALWCDPVLSPTPESPWSAPVENPAELESITSTQLADTRIVTVVAMVAASADPPIERYLTVYVGDGRLSVCGLEQGNGWIRDVSHQELVDRLTSMVQ